MMKCLRQTDGNSLSVQAMNARSRMLRTNITEAKYFSAEKIRIAHNMKRKHIRQIIDTKSESDIKKKRKN